MKKLLNAILSFVRGPVELDPSYMTREEKDAEIRMLEARIADLSPPIKNARAGILDKLKKYPHKFGTRSL